MLKYKAFTNVMRQGFENWKKVSTGKVHGERLKGTGSGKGSGEKAALEETPQSCGPSRVTVLPLDLPRRERRFANSTYAPHTHFFSLLEQRCLSLTLEGKE